MSMLSDASAGRIISRLGRWPHRGPERIVMRDSPDAARYMTGIKGWVSRLGHYYGDNESTARYDGCTHVACRHCGKPVERMWTACKGCRDLADLDKWNAMPRKPWDGESMVFSQSQDKYFNSPSDAEDDLAEGETLEDLQLVLCEPNCVRPLEEDYCCDELSEDGDLPNKVGEAMEAFNAAVAGIVLSWSPGKYALDLSESQQTTTQDAQ